ncbi:MAG: hypothetical protein E7576_03755 [Ruminococcaceae bacterium]|nr:hypothetical protein [Oscillospiraceae bacterium]
MIISTVQIYSKGSTYMKPGIKKLLSVLLFALMIAGMLTVTVQAASVLIGDVDGNGKVTKADSTVLARYIAGWNGYAARVNMYAANLNGDAGVSTVDSIILERYLAGWKGYDKYIKTVQIGPLNVKSQPAGGSLTDDVPSLTLSTAATGGITPYTYQWYKDGSLISGAVSDHYTATEAGRYYCVIKDSYGQTATTNTAQVTSSKLTIKSQPVGGIVGYTKLSVTVSGGKEPYRYQWYKEGSGPIRGATSASYSPSSVGDYYCKVTDAKGTTITSDTATVHSASLAISKQTEGGTLGVTLSVTVTGGKTPYSYQWYKEGSGLISGAASDSYKPTAVGNYYCKVTDSTGTTVTSKTMNVIYGPLTITGQPKSGVLYETTFWVTVSGGKPPYYFYWCYEDGMVVSGEYGPSFKPKGSGGYYCEVTDGNGDTVKSDIAYVYTTALSASLKCYSQTVGREITVSAWGGKGPYSYKWYKEGSGLIRGATSDSYTPASLGKYCCVVTDSIGNTLTSDPISIIYERLRFTRQPVGGILGEVTLSVAVAGGKEPYSYQWYIKFDGKDFRQGDDAKDASYKPWDDPNKYVTLGNPAQS